MAGIQDIGIGFGYLYVTDMDGTTISSTQPNNKTGALTLRSFGDLLAPFAGKRGAYSTITITSVNGAGAVTNISVNNMNQIGVPVTLTGMTEVQAAAAMAAAIENYSPGAGWKFRASSIGDQIFMFAPAEAGELANGFVPVISALSVDAFGEVSPRVTVCVPAAVTFEPN